VPALFVTSCRRAALAAHHLLAGMPLPRRRIAWTGNRSLDQAYARLRKSIETKDVADDRLKDAALQALERAKMQVELDL
jgi:hypothetical protein